jgi:hypothetical protein
VSSSTDIQRELEETRARMSAELDALGHKLDLPSRAKDRASAASHRVRRAVPSATHLKGTAEKNPLGLVVGGLALGFLAGMLIPQTEFEDEKLGPLADQARDQAVATGREALQRGKSVARKTAESAAQAAQEAGKQQADGLRRTSQRRAEDLAQ